VSVIGYEYRPKSACTQVKAKERICADETDFRSRTVQQHLHLALSGDGRRKAIDVCQPVHLSDKDHETDSRGSLQRAQVPKQKAGTSTIETALPMMESSRSKAEALFRQSTWTQSMLATILGSSITHASHIIVLRKMPWTTRGGLSFESLPHETSYLRKSSSSTTARLSLSKHHTSNGAERTIV
jgi:hypothetical protein